MLRCLDTWNVHLAKPGNKYWVIVLGWNNEVFIFWYHPPRVKCVCVCEQGGRLVCSHPGERGRQTRSIYLFVCAAIPQPTDCILNLRFRFSEWLMCRVYCFVLLLSTVISLQPRFYCKAVCWKINCILFIFLCIYVFICLFLTDGRKSRTWPKASWGLGHRISGTHYASFRVFSQCISNLIRHLEWASAASYSKTVFKRGKATYYL